MDLTKELMARIAASPVAQIERVLFWLNTLVFFIDKALLFVPMYYIPRRWIL
jgi:hypothetical protein